MAGIAESQSTVHCEWSLGGLAAFASTSDVVVIVDVLSFSTCVEIAVSRGAVVYPFPWKDSRAAEFARERGAELAGQRGETLFSLSPVSFCQITSGTSVVLPSPNGAALSLAAGQVTVLAGCLRNARAVGRAAQAIGKRALVVSAGEQWSDGSLRPCLEDWLGAGAVLDGMYGEFSPEAEAARDSFRAAAGDLKRLVRDCMSGRELVRRGYGNDVELAVELSVSDVVPVLRDAFESLCWPD